MSSIADNFNKIKEELNGHPSRIIAVSKYVSTKEMIDAYDAGVRDFGEAKAVDSLIKLKELPKEIVDNCCWHFIGHLQSNKAKKVVGNFDYIHSIDSLKLAQAINTVAQNKGIKQKILLQVNIASEESKFGFSKDEIRAVLPEIIKLDSVSVEGLMMMAPYTEDKAYLTKLFSDTSIFKGDLERAFGLTLKELSMGMSNDYKIAAKEGSTMVRVGTKIFN